MKKTAILLSLLATCFMFAGCTNSNPYDQPAAAPVAPEAPPAHHRGHHDYKGEG